MRFGFRGAPCRWRADLGKVPPYAYVAAGGKVLFFRIHGIVAVEMSEEEVGRVSNYFSRIGVAAIEITSGTIKVGDTIRIKGVKTDFTQMIDSMEIDRRPIEMAQKGSSVGIKVKDRVRPNDVVFKVL